MLPVSVDAVFSFVVEVAVYLHYTSAMCIKYVLFGVLQNQCMAEVHIPAADLPDQSYTFLNTDG